MWPHSGEKCAVVISPYYFDDAYETSEPGHRPWSLPRFLWPADKGEEAAGWGLDRKPGPGQSSALGPKGPAHIGLSGTFRNLAEEENTCSEKQMGCILHRSPPRTPDAGKGWEGASPPTPITSPCLSDRSGFPGANRRPERSEPRCPYSCRFLRERG